MPQRFIALLCILFMWLVKPCFKPLFVYTQSLPPQFCTKLHSAATSELVMPLSIFKHDCASFAAFWISSFVTTKGSGDSAPTAVLQTSSRGRSLFNACSANALIGGDAPTNGCDIAAVSYTTNGEIFANALFALFLIDSTDGPFFSDFSFAICSFASPCPP